MELSVKQSYLLSSPISSMSPPIYTEFSYIYPGPHQDSNGKIDERTWFNIPIEIDVDEGSITYLIFPYGGSDEEVKEITVSAAGSWID